MVSIERQLEGGDRAKKVGDDDESNERGRERARRASGVICGRMTMRKIDRK